MRSAGVEQRPMQVGAMDHGIGVAEILAERFVQRAAKHLFSGHAVHHDQIIDVNRLGAAGIADAEIIHGVEGVRSDLNTGADFAELLGLFEHSDAATLIGEPQGGRQTANSASSDDRCRPGIRCNRHDLPPGRIAASLSIEQYTFFQCTVNLPALLMDHARWAEPSGAPRNHAQTPTTPDAYADAQSRLLVLPVRIEPVFQP